MSDEQLDSLVMGMKKSRGENYHERMLRLREEYGEFR